MKRNIINAIVIFFVTFAVLLVVSEVSKTDQDPAHKITHSFDLNQ